ncbi:MAG: EAL domain-containing protein [Acidobacteriaceae bacterium]|nr:EAL domain-containing protein [Acidobacteriaceae bacterium]
MRCPSTLVDESGRLRALEEYALSERLGLPALAPVVRLAAEMFRMPMSAVNLIGEQHVFFAASYGIDACDMSRDASFCAHAILQDDVMVVPDATHDVRFHDNPLVTGEPGIRFYAGMPLRSPSGHAIGALCVIDREPHAAFSERDQERLRDFAALVSDKLELRRLEVAQQMSRFHEIAATSPGPLLGFNRKLELTFCNVAAAAVLGASRETLLGRRIGEILPRLDERRILEFIGNVIATGVSQHAPIETLALRAEGAMLPVEVVFFTWKEEGEERCGLMLTDITERRNHEQELFRLENFDKLTGLANRKVLRHEVAGALEEHGAMALIVIDLDSFKDMNDTLGYKAGDELLHALSERMSRLLKPGDMLARMGGDEFAVLLRGRELPAVRAFANTLLTSIGKRLDVAGHSIRVTASCGIAHATEQQSDAEELLGNADLALYQAKSLGRGHVSVYLPALRQEAIERRQFDAELHHAVENEEFELFYQPQIHLETGSLVGAEALIRWRHPQKGYLAPAAFLPLLEVSSLAGTVGTWVLRKACEQASLWGQRDEGRFRMGVNLFAAQFLNGDLVELVQQSIDEYRLLPRNVELEITENIILNQDAAILDTLRQLREAGVCIAFDDFGTGFASLSLLRDYPVTQIKIDRSFISNMCCSTRDEATVAATIGLARNYDLDVIAEGIETEEQLQKLKRIGCDEGQGYLFGKPMPATEFEKRFLAS